MVTFPARLQLLRHTAGAGVGPSTTCYAHVVGFNVERGEPERISTNKAMEIVVHKERQLEGIAKAKANGIYKGRKPSIDPAQVRAMRDAGRSPSAIARELNLARSSVYRVLG